MATRAGPRRPLTGAGAAASQAGGTIGKLASETATAMVTSSLKQTVDSTHSFQVRVWAFTLDFSSDGEVHFGAHYQFLGTLAFTGLANIQQYADGTLQSQNRWDWDKLTLEIDDPDADFLSWTLDTLGTDSYNSTVSLYDVMGAVARGVTSYATDRGLAATGASKMVWELAEMGLARSDPGFKAVLDEAGFADFTKGEVDED